MRIFGTPRTAYAHCDLPCGVYDPAQARIEAESCFKIAEKYAGNQDPAFRQRVDDAALRILRAKEAFGLLPC